MITYDEWFKIQSEIESRAREIWSIYARIYKVYRPNEYSLDGIDTENGIKFSAYIHEYDETEYLDTKLLFMSDDEIEKQFTEDMIRIELEEKERQDKEELARAKITEESERKYLAILKAKYESKIN